MFLPPEDFLGTLAERAHITQGENGLLGHPRPTGRFHITVANVTTLLQRRGALTDKANLKIPMLIKPIRPFNFVFDRVKSFSGSNACVLATNGNNPEFRTLCRQIHRELEVEVSPVPHVTLLYDSEVIAEKRLKTPIIWSVQELSFVEAVNRQSCFEKHASWSLHSAFPGA